MRITISLMAALAIALAAGSAAGADSARDQAEVVKGNNDFAAELYGALCTKPGNIFFSPYSISSALAMTWAGARKETEEEMAKVLHFNLEQDRFHGGQKALRKSLMNRRGRPRRDEDPEDAPKPFELVVGNSLWGQKGFAFKADFLDLVKANYQAGLSEVDFRGDGEGARKKINGWVEEVTRDKIKDLIPKSIRLDDCRLVLANAIYFKSAWIEAFNEKNTKKEPFHVAKDKIVTVPVMHRHGMFGQGEAESCRIAALSYKGGDLSMLVIVPKAVDGLPALERSLTPERLRTWTKDLDYCSYDLGLPRFKMTFSVSLVDALKSLGMKKAFEPASADFSGMTGGRDLYIDQILHKAFVDVNEAGTEAAAATAVLMGPTGMPRQGKPLLVDRPFLFFIRDNRTGAILFMGRVADPTR